MRSAGLAIPALLALAAIAAAGEPPTVADVTERGRGLDRILDALLAPDDPEADRSLLLLVDPTETLRAAEFDRELAEALERNADRLAKTRIGVARTGGKGGPELPPTADRGEVAPAVEALLAKPVKTFQNVYADVRRLAASLAGTAGAREMVLVTLDNGDAEDDLEATAAALRRSGVRLSVIARQAFLSDSYWIRRESQAPRRMEMHGEEAGFVEVPWGWLFQRDPNEATPSGFAMFGLSRLAAVSGGRVFVYYPRSTTGHQCSAFGGCPFCNGDHIPNGESYQTHRLRALAPAVGSRREVRAAAVKDPAYRAVLRAWSRASKEGLVASRPSIRPDGSPERRRIGRPADFSDSLSFSRHAARAGKLARAAEGIAADLEGELDQAEEAGGNARYRAIGEYTFVMLHLTRVNLLGFAAWCREVGPALVALDRDSLAPPEIPPYSPEQRPVGIGFTPLSLCHGLAPFRQVHLPGGEAFRRELDAFATHVEGFLARQAHTPFAVALHRAGIARFQLLFRGKYVPPPKRRVPGTDEDATATSRDRPSRGGGSGGGSGGGTTSGGDE